MILSPPLKTETTGRWQYVPFGSANLSNTLINAELFDEYRIGIVPIILGKGRQLFTPEHKQQHLKLIENHHTATDCVIVRYRRDRSAETDN